MRPEGLKYRKGREHRNIYVNIAASAEDMDGTHPSFFFAGAPIALIRQIFNRLVGSRDLMADRAEVNTRFIVRQGKPREEITVELINPNTRFYPPGLMRELITILISAATPGKVTWLPIDKFINIYNTKPWDV